MPRHQPVVEQNRREPEARHRRPAVCVCVCVRARARARVCACARVCMCLYGGKANHRRPAASPRARVSRVQVVCVCVWMQRPRLPRGLQALPWLCSAHGSVPCAASVSLVVCVAEPCVCVCVYAAPTARSLVLHHGQEVLTATSFLLPLCCITSLALPCAASRPVCCLVLPTRSRSPSPQ